MFKIKVISAIMFLGSVIGFIDYNESIAIEADFDKLFYSETPSNNTDIIKIRKTDERITKVSWYGPKFHGKLTANGELYDQMKLTAAHKTLPFGTMLLLTNSENGKQAIVRINDRGPYMGDREIDISKGAAIALGSLEKGVVMMYVEQLTPRENIQPI